MMIRRLLLLIAVCLLLAACGRERTAVTPYDAGSLANLQLGRDYAAQGRYELAREHLLLALASSNSPETRQVIAHDLKSVDLMIQTQR